MVIALMSGPFSLVREVLQIIDPAKYPDKPLFVACLLAAFMVAMFLLWLDEFQARKKAEKLVYENRPIFGILVHGTEGPNEWERNPVPLVLTIQRLGGRIPTAISFDTILSKHGKFSLRFDALPHIYSSPQESEISFEVMEIGAPQLSAKDWETTRPYQKQMLGLFLDDSPIELLELDYSLTVHFLDGTDWRSQQFTLTFDKQKWRFSVSPLPR